MNQKVKDEIIKKVLACEFEEAENLVKQISSDVLENLLLKIGYDYSQSVVIYAFICHLIRKNEDITYHFIAETVLCGPLCYIEGAYNIALYHNKRILKIDKNNLKAMIMMLFYNTLPTPLVSNEDARKYAEKIITIEPQNRIAMQLLDKIK